MVRGRLSRELRAVFCVGRQAIMPGNALDALRHQQNSASERLPRLSGCTASRNTDAECWPSVRSLGLRHRHEAIQPDEMLRLGTHHKQGKPQRCLAMPQHRQTIVGSDGQLRR